MHARVHVLVACLARDGGGARCEQFESNQVTSTANDNSLTSLAGYNEPVAKTGVPGVKLPKTSKQETGSRVSVLISLRLMNAQSYIICHTKALPTPIHSMPKLSHAPVLQIDRAFRTKLLWTRSFECEQYLLVVRFSPRWVLCVYLDQCRLYI